MELLSLLMSFTGMPKGFGSHAPVYAICRLKTRGTV